MSLMPNITYQIDNSIKIDSNFIVAIISLVVSIISLILATYIFYYQSLKSRQLVHFESVVKRVELINDLAEKSCCSNCFSNGEYAKFTLHKQLLAESLEMFFSHNFYYWFYEEKKKKLIDKLDEYIEFIELYTYLETNNPIEFEQNQQNLDKVLKELLIKSSKFILELQKLY